MALEIRKIPFEKMEFKMFVIDELCDSLKKKGRKVIKLTLGKSELPLAKEIKQVFASKVFDHKDSLLVYPQGLPQLKKGIARHYKKEDIIVRPENIAIGAGTSSLIKDLFRVLIRNGEEVLIPKPYYPAYYFGAIFGGAQVRFYGIDLKTKRIDLESFKNNFSPKNTKLVILCSPGNPLGNTITKEEFKKIIKIVGKNAFILSDEIYNNVVFEDKPLSILAVAKSTGNIIVSNGFSKGFRMYTKRVGYFILPEKLVLPFRVLQQHGLLTVDPVTQFACIKALKKMQDLKNLTKIYKERRNYTVKSLNDVKDITLIIPEGGFYFTIDCKKFMKKKSIENSFELAKDILLKTGVGVVPGSDFGLERTIRLSFTNPKYNKAIDSLQKYFMKG